MKSREALARDEFTKNNSELYDMTTLVDDNKAIVRDSIYLKNRIETAFLAGVNAGKRIAIDQAVDNFENLLWGCQDD